MVKKILFRWAAEVLVMIGLPWLAVTFAPADAGMAIVFLLFFAVNPIFALVDGYLAGKDPKRTWQEPLMTALLFLLGAWLFFDRGEPAFYRYALVYLGLGYLAMGISARTKK